MRYVAPFVKPSLTASRTPLDARTLELFDLFIQVSGFFQHLGRMLAKHRRSRFHAGRCRAELDRRADRLDDRDGDRRAGEAKRTEHPAQACEGRRAGKAKRFDDAAQASEEEPSTYGLKGVPTPVPCIHAVGSTFALRRNRLVGSYLFLICTNRG